MYDIGCESGFQPKSCLRIELKIAVALDIYAPWLHMPNKKGCCTINK
jgi:hypothetical protein